MTLQYRTSLLSLLEFAYALLHPSVERNYLTFGAVLCQLCGCEKTRPYGPLLRLKGRLLSKMCKNPVRDTDKHLLCLMFSSESGKP